LKYPPLNLIITKSISRFARNTVTLLETVRELKDLDVDVYFEEQNILILSIKLDTNISNKIYAASLMISLDCRGQTAVGSAYSSICPIAHIIPPDHSF